MRFACGARVCEVAVTATPADPARSATLDPLTVGNRAPDPAQMVEITRAVTRLGDIRSLHLRCLLDGGEPSPYGVHAMARRARICARISAGSVRDVGFSVEQTRRQNSRLASTFPFLTIVIPAKAGVHIPAQ